MSTLFFMLFCLTLVQGKDNGNSARAGAGDIRTSRAADPRVSAQNSPTEGSPTARRKAYYIYLEKATWEQAVSKCKAQNMTLASIRSAEEQEEFHRESSKLDMFRKYTWTWLGATDLGREAHDVVWVGDNSRLNFTKWGKDEEDHTDPGYNCVAMAVTQWFMSKCSWALKYACEYVI